jgi:predicted RNA-binding Zn-ribbon protein involved in translation (DUF1610 family)
MQWYYLNEAGEVFGPVLEETLLELRSTGQIQDETLVCREGTETWISLADSFGQNSQNAPVVDDSLKFSCPHCGQHIAAGHADAGASTQCPTCGGMIVVPGESVSSVSAIAPVRHRNRKLVAIASIGGLAGLLILGSLIVWRLGAGEGNPAHGATAGNSPDENRKMNQADSKSPTTRGLAQNHEEKGSNIFSSRSSQKDEVLGLRGGMSKEEAMATLKLAALNPATSDECYGAPWESTMPGFSAYEFEPGESFPIKHLRKIRLVFLKGRLQSLCYVYVEMPVQISLYKNKRIEVKTDTLDFTYKTIFPDRYNRSKLISDVEAILAGNFDIIDDGLYPDYTSGRYIPKSGKFDVDCPKVQGHREFTYSAAPIFNAASSEIFVRFYSSIKNRENLLEDLSYQIMRPELFRVDAKTGEIFFLQFSFRNTYQESLAVAEAKEAKEAAILAAERAERQRKNAEAEAEERRKEDERVKNLRKGL